MPIITPAYPCMNSSYNVSASTLRVIEEPFHFGNKVCEDIELNKENWSVLFEPSLFFEFYKKMLMTCLHGNDGWNPALDILLTRLKLIRNACYSATLSQMSMLMHLNRVLIVHFLWGFQRQPGVKVEENQQFDIRGTVECFKQDVMRYAHWRPGMDIFVSHVRRRELPSYIFPKGYNRRQRQLRHAPPSSGDTTPSSERRSKRRHDDASVADSGPGKLKKQTSVSSESTVPVIQDLASESPIAQKVVMESEDGSNTEPMQTPTSIRLSLESTA